MRSDGLQAAVAQQGVDLRLTATEGLVHRHAIVDAARREDMLAELVGNLGVEDVTRLGKGLKGIGVEHLGPHVAVVAGRVTTTHRVLYHLLG